MVAASMLLAVLPGCGSEANEAGEAAKKVLVLGCDGMDYRLVGRMLDEGRLPNLAKLRAQGGFRPLTTSIPPQSPVAWSNFITGAGPGVHGIFDFIHRDPDRQAVPYFSTSMDLPGAEPLFTLPIGEHAYPSDLANPWADKGETVLMRKGTPFWDYLDYHGVPVTMYRLAANYPPSPSKYGHMRCLAGMGVPDVFSTQGTYQHFTTRPRRESRPGGGMLFRLRSDRKNGGYSAKLRGPKNEFLPKSKKTGEPPEMSITLNIYPDREHDVAKIVWVNESVLGNETVDLILNVGQWSEWKDIQFQKTPAMSSFPTMARFLLQQVRPEIELYVTPLNFVPSHPEAVFSEPSDFVEEIAEVIGPFYTQGFAEDFKARDQGVFTDEEYKIQADIVLAERLKLMDYALDHFEQGLLFFYFSSSDLQAHIFWWDSDEPHPFRSPEEARKYQAVVEALYERLDAAVGRCMERVGEESTVMVMSDHGFCNFRRGVSVNTWLRNEGYLVTDKSVMTADWAKTRAYGIGVSCNIYLNLRGREKYGIVAPGERDALLDEITEKLTKLVDPETGQRVIHRVYNTDDWYSGPEAKNAPDLILGYARGYRASWNSCLGGFDKDVIIDNKKPWSADHCTAHDLVPGILFCNKPVSTQSPALIDIAPTILAEFGIARPAQMTGRSFLGKATRKLAAR